MQHQSCCIFNINLQLHLPLKPSLNCSWLVLNFGANLSLVVRARWGGGGGLITTSEKITTFLAYPKNPLVLFLQPPKIPAFFCDPKKVPASFIDLKKSLLAKISDPKISLWSPVIKIYEWGPWAGTVSTIKHTFWKYVKCDCLQTCSRLLCYVWLMEAQRN